MKIYDISVPLAPPLVTWPGEQPPVRKEIKNLKKDGAEVSHLSLGTHSGTHIDAPRHFIEGGAGIEAIDLKHCIGEAVVLDLTYINGNLILPKHLEAAGATGAKRILCKTQNSVQRLMEKTEFTEKYVSISAQGAQWLTKNGTVLVGVDYLSVEKKGSPGHPVHMTLLEAKSIIIEGCNLADVPAGNYILTALPLKIPHSDGAPARVILQGE